MSPFVAGFLGGVWSLFCIFGTRRIVEDIRYIRKLRKETVFIPEGWMAESHVCREVQVGNTVDYHHIFLLKRIPVDEKEQSC